MNFVINIILRQVNGDLFYSFDFHVEYKKYTYIIQLHYICSLDPLHLLLLTYQPRFSLCCRIKQKKNMVTQGLRKFNIDKKTQSPLDLENKQ